MSKNSNLAAVVEGRRRVADRGRGVVGGGWTQMKNKNTKMTNDVNKKKTHFCQKKFNSKEFCFRQKFASCHVAVEWCRNGRDFFRKTERMGVSNRRRRRIIFKANRRKKKKMKILQILLCADVKGFVSPPMNRRRMLWTFWLFFFRPKERLVVETLSMRLQFREHSFCFETKFKERETERERVKEFLRASGCLAALLRERLSKTTHTQSETCSRAEKCPAQNQWNPPKYDRHTHSYTHRADTPKHNTGCSSFLLETTTSLFKSIQMN